MSLGLLLHHVVQVYLYFLYRFRILQYPNAIRYTYHTEHALLHRKKCIHTLYGIDHTSLRTGIMVLKKYSTRSDTVRVRFESPKDQKENYSKGILYSSHLRQLEWTRLNPQGLYISFIMALQGNHLYRYCYLWVTFEENLHPFDHHFLYLSICIFMLVHLSYVC